MTPETVKTIFCVVSVILIFYWKMFGGKPNDNR